MKIFLFLFNLPLHVADICRNQTAGYGLILKISQSVQTRDLMLLSEQLKAAVEDNGVVHFLSCRGGHGLRRL